MKSTKTLAAAVCALFVVATGCSGSSGGDSKSANGKQADFVTGGTFTTTLGADPGTLHPLLAQTVVVHTVLPFAYDSLINLDASGKVVSQLASSWKAEPTSVTFTLRNGVTCSDGHQLTASDVAANFTYVKNPKNASPTIGDNLPSTDFTIASDDAAGTVTVTVPDPYGFLLVGAGTLPIVCPKGLADPKILARGTDGTGPFTLVENVADDHLTFAVRKGYHWGPDGAGTKAAGFPAKVVFKIISDSTTGVNLLLAGQVNDAGANSADQARLDGHGFDTTAVVSGPQDLFFNQRKGRPTADIAVRKALTMALDLPALIKVVTENSGGPAPSLAVVQPRPCRINTVKGSLPGHDPAGAGSMLDQAGWLKGADGTRAKGGEPLKVTLIYPSSSGAAGAAGMELVSQWWRALGVQVKLKTMSETAFVPALFGGTSWDTAVLGVNLAYPHQFRTYATGALPPKAQNFSGIANPDYERISAQALQTLGDAGCKLWADAEHALFANVDVVPVAVTRSLTYVDKARYRDGLAGPEPTSIRLLAN
jgi:peptide/nickel transport system substrate-binding protein